MTGPIVLGIDGGGTSTTARLTVASGEVIGRGEAGPSNVKAVGATKALEALGTAIATAYEDARWSGAPVAAACLGLAGFDRPEDRALLENWAAGLNLADRLLLVNDGEIVLAAGTPGGFGIGVIAGTGAIAVGKTSDGRSARAGGWGYLFGDEGSAYAVAVAGLRLVARRVDGREALRVLKGTYSAAEPPRDGGPLGRHLAEALGVPGPGAFISTIYAPGFDRARVAALAPAVVAASEDDPEVLPWILEPAGYELGQTVLAVAAALGWDEPVLPLALAGSFLLSAAPVAEAMSDYLRRFAPFEVVSTRVPEPVEGALILARRAIEAR